ncbi:glutathione S-transferase family protein [Shimia haliotis]|uniref:Glutathione S-transferase n=1 Tax=Shimia haliotis TaxID=1280847 RepID=A0A1I4D9V3_9RHOB|nr:glutathione S-transferase family protein [Shimia haliotis]SFK90574.1 Glutathione S-transferase [Shimia haliotis]
MQLIMFPGNNVLPSHSPFCMKAICLLEMAGIAWQPEISVDVSVQPLGKLPVLRVGDQLIPDSSNIEDLLTSEGADFYADLSTEQKAISHAIKSMVEYSLVLGLVHDRWLDPQVWPIMREEFFAEVPSEAREMVAEQGRAPVRAGLTSHGIARFSAQDRKKRLGRDLAMLETVLGDKAFLFGDTPTGADAAIAPVLDMILRLPAETDLRKAVEEVAAFTPYVARVRSAIYPGGNMRGCAAPKQALAS